MTPSVIDQVVAKLCDACRRRVVPVVLQHRGRVAARTARAKRARAARVLARALVGASQ